jgi:hypothetical protein
MGRRHAQDLVRLFIEAAIGVVAGVKNGFRHRVATAQFIAHPILFGTTVADVVNYDFSKSNQVVVWNHEALSTSGT